MWGAGLPVAYAAQFSLAAGIAISLMWIWRSHAAFELKATALAVGSLLATPYVLDYDLMVLAIAIAFFARHGLDHGFRAGEISLLALTWIMPLLTRSIAGAIELPLGFLVMVAFYIIVLRRALADNSTSRHLHTQIAAA
jgi:membrane protein CcdC involved in cytochrome C biogenesis